MRTLFILAICIYLAGLANADISNAKIKAYNEAVNAGSDLDAIMSASIDLAVEAINNPDDESASLLAFEAAWMLCQTGNCDKGAKAAAFSASQPEGPVGAYPSLNTRKVLASYITWKSDDSKTNRNKLVSSLASLTSEDVSQISVTAHREHFLYCTSKGAWQDAAKAAAAAADHTSAFKNELFDEYAFAELTRITSDFNSRKRIEHYESITQLERDLNTTLKTLEETQPDANTAILETLSYRTQAWKGAIGAYFVTTDKERTVKRIDAKFAAVEGSETDTLPRETDFCQGGFDSPPRVEYPESAAEDGRIGSLIVGFTVDHGETKNVRVLAAVPENIFDKEAIKAIDELTWSPAPSIDTSKCSLVHENLVYPIIFTLD